MPFKKVESQVSFPKMEEDILKFWGEYRIFEKSVANREGAKQYSFYDGPPFATGTPHYGHIVASAIKDTVPRYFTMKGFHVERKWGWDCHGLPIENIAEKELGITHKKEIENLGVEKFNETCRSKVLEYVAEWKKVIRRFGRWADMENAYRTMDVDYMESVWRVFKELWDRGLIYESYRAMHICPRCETTLSQSEVAEGYKMVKDLSVVAKFEIDQSDVDDIAIASIQKGDERLFVYQKEEGQYFFVGGKAEEGENFKETLARECKEEIGVEISVVKKLYQSFRVYQGRLKRIHVFEAEIISGEPILLEDQYDELVWRKRKPVEDLYKDLEMNRLNLVLDGKMPTTVEKISLLAWTTTPWTLPGNVALAIGKDIEYAMVYSDNFPNELLILASDRLEAFTRELGEYFVVFVQKGEQLNGAKYLPLFDYYTKDEKLENHKQGWKIYGAGFVATEEGTGAVHVAPAFGEDDMELGKQENLPFIQHVNMDGTMKDEAADFAGMQVKPKENPQATDVEIIKYLARTRRLFSKEKYEHSYPHCWRCDTPLLNYATSSWFVNVIKIKDRALELAKNINWSPAHLKEGRFGNWLTSARDWSISRQRYWASVLPIWRCAEMNDELRIANYKKGCGQIKVFGSVEELEKVSRKKVDDLHKHVVDKITFPCEECGGTMRRIPDVLDTWFDSGSMPYAQAHYPFENKEKFEQNFPADFIAEGVDQTRAWFYYLHIVAASIKDSHAFRNVIVNGIVLAEDGKKMSKKLKNYPDPMEIIEKYGADVLRYYLLSSPVVSAENIDFSERELQDVSRNMFRMLWNSYSFFTTYASIDKWEPKKNNMVSENVLDKWIFAELQVLLRDVTESMDNYELSKAPRAFTPFIDNLSNWYVRRSRKRFWKSEDDTDKECAYQTLYEVLITLAKLMAPFTPFLSDEIYKNLTGEESVHLVDWPIADEKVIDEQLINDMRSLREVISIGLRARSKKGVKVRQPLRRVLFPQKYGKLFDRLIRNKDWSWMLHEELNVKGAEIGDYEDVTLDWEITEELKHEGEAREIIRVIQDGRKKAGFNVEDRITLDYRGKEKVFEKFGEMIGKEVLAVKTDNRPINDAEYSESIELEGEKFEFQLKRV